MPSSKFEANIHQFFLNYFKSISQSTITLDFSLLEKIAHIIFRAHHSKSKIILIGNGGSAAMASHVSVDLTKTAGIRSINFNEADLLTCFANDYGYEHWVEKALEAYADPGDVVILISSSGKSPNIINGANQAKKMGLSFITLTGFSSENPLRKMGDVNLWCDSNSYNVVEMTHHIWLLAIVDYIISIKAA